MYEILDYKTLYWFYSTLAQVIGAFIAILGVFAVFSMQKNKNEIELIENMLWVVFQNKGGDKDKTSRTLIDEFKKNSENDLNSCYESKKILENKQDPNKYDQIELNRIKNKIKTIKGWQKEFQNIENLKKENEIIVKRTPKVIFYFIIELILSLLGLMTCKFQIFCLNWALFIFVLLTTSYLFLYTSYFIQKIILTKYHERLRKKSHKGG